MEQIIYVSHANLNIDPLIRAHRHIWRGIQQLLYALFVGSITQHMFHLQYLSSLIPRLSFSFSGGQGEKKKRPWERG